MQPPSNLSGTSPVFEYDIDRRVETSDELIRYLKSDFGCPMHQKRVIYQTQHGNITVHTLLKRENELISKVDKDVILPSFGVLDLIIPLMPMINLDIVYGKKTTCKLFVKLDEFQSTASPCAGRIVRKVEKFACKHQRRYFSQPFPWDPEHQDTMPDPVTGEIPGTESGVRKYVFRINTHDGTYQIMPINRSGIEDSLEDDDLPPLESVD